MYGRLIISQIVNIVEMYWKMGKAYNILLGNSKEKIVWNT